MNQARPVLPQMVRAAMVAAIMLSALEVCAASSDLSEVLNINERELREQPLPDILPPGELEAARAAAAAQFAVEKSMLETMSVSRALILMALAGCASMAFLASLRIRWPSGFPRSASARLLGGSAFAAALFRTLDGAQGLVIERRSSEAALKAVLDTPNVHDSMLVIMGLRALLSIGVTLFIVGLFVTIGHYFRSERVQSMFITLDGPEPEPDDE